MRQCNEEVFVNLGVLPGEDLRKVELIAFPKRDEKKGGGERDQVFLWKRGILEIGMISRLHVI